MDNELHYILYDLEETFEDTKYFINNLKNFSIKDNDIKGAKHRNKENYGKLQKTLFYNKIFLRALDHKLEESYKAIIESRDNGDMI